MDSGSLVTCSIWCSVFFEGEDHVFQLRESDTLERVFSEIETHWPAFDCDTYVVQYKAAHMEDESWITLKKDQDVESMVAVHGLAKQHIAKLRAIQPPSSSSQRRDDQGMTSTSQALVVHNSNNNESWSRCIRRVGQAFKDANDCRVHLKNYHIAVNRKFKYMKNDTDKIITTCPDENCN